MTINLLLFVVGCSIMYFGSEYLIDNSMIEKAEKNLLLCLKDNYVLCEFSYVGMTVNYHEIIYKLILNGYRPILAHPERYFYFDKNMKQMFNLKKMGCKFQLNLFSTTGYYGKKVLSLSNLLIKKNFIDHQESTAIAVFRFALYGIGLEYLFFNIISNLMVFEYVTILYAYIFTLLRGSLCHLLFFLFWVYL